MRKADIARAGLLAITLAVSASSASAQAIEFGPGGLRVDPGFEPRERLPPPPRFDGISEREAVRIARRQGVDEVERVRETPRGWIISGTDSEGEDIRVVISRDGEVIDVR
jgi:hypothetical protein